MSELATVIAKRLKSPTNSRVWDVPGVVLDAVVRATLEQVIDALGGDEMGSDEVLALTVDQVFNEEWALTEDGGLYPEADVVDCTDVDGNSARLHRKMHERFTREHAAMTASGKAH
ncbi:MAG: hypothetical protein AAFV29_17470 [Myxococcota bacterium]